jgi:hypothetical protein
MKLNSWQVLKIRTAALTGAGIWTTDGLHNFLHQHYRAVYYRIHIGIWAEDFIKREDVKLYYREHMPYTWVGIYKNGQIPLGITTRAEAHKRLIERIPKAVVLYDDDVFPYIFFKIPDDTQ